MSNLFAGWRKGVEWYLKPFETDGCSGGMSALWRWLTGVNPPWEGHCIEHDKAYWQGGTKGARRNADLMLMARVTLQGYPFWAFVMYVGVRFGGHPLLPTSWRWGYGYDWPRPYTKV